MEPTPTYTMKLSQEELLLISLKLKLPLMLGIDEKMLQLPQADLQAILESAEQSLLARDFLRAAADGSLRLAPVLLAMIVTCAQPAKSLMVTRTLPPRGPVSLMIHQSYETIVNHAVAESGAHTFVLLPDFKPVVDSMLKHSHAGEYARGDTPPGQLPESVYVQANELAQALNPAQLFALLAQHLPERTAIGFHQTLTNYDGSVLVLRMLHGETPEALQKDGFTLLQGGGLQWLVRSTGAPPERTLTIEPVAVKEVRQALKRLIGPTAAKPAPRKKG